ncbi:MAG: transposase [Acidobacteriota bacterium]|nr:transposase [Acidobacteriota bacterium]
MQVAEPSLASPLFPFSQAAVATETSAQRAADEPNLSEMPIDELREAIRKSQVTFPAQVPSFPKHDRSDIQRQLVQLYFVRGWSGPKIGVRYGLRRLRVQQILNAWKRRAVELGYIQCVPAAEVFTRRAQSALPVVITSVLNGSAAPVSSPFKSLRPRAKFNIAEIVSVLEQLQAGRTVGELAHELGVSAYTIRLWKDQHEVHFLRHENAQLKARLASLNAVEKTLIDIITRSDSAKAPSFMPFSRVASHTDSDYRESH